MSSTLVRVIEPGAPSPERRLQALQTLHRAGFWTTVRLNPWFPIYPDGYFTDPDFTWPGEVPQFEFSSFEILDQIAEYEIPSVLAGFVRLSSFSLNRIKKACGFDLRPFFRLNRKSARDFHYSDREIRHYYEEIRERCQKYGIQFSTCYIGNGENQFWRDQDLWSNRRDCCNVKSRVTSFVHDARNIPFSARLKFVTKKTAIPTSTRLHEPLESTHA